MNHQIKILAIFLAIFASGHGETLNCGNFIMKSFQTAPSTAIMLYTCSGNPGVGPVTNVSGIHLPGKSNADVQGIYLFSQASALNPGITNFFPNIIAIRYEAAQIASITAMDLQPYPNLISLDMSQNGIETLDANLFQYTPHISFVDLSQNLIIRVGTNIFAGLNALVIVDLAGNLCIDTNASTPNDLLILIQLLETYCQPCPSEESTNALKAKIRYLENQLSEKAQCSK